jgi:hypothetical protein
MLTTLMDQNFQQLDFPSLIDLLAEETKKYTKAFISGNLLESAYHRAKIDALIAEIVQRKPEALFPPDHRWESPPDNFTDSIPTTI